MIAVIEKQTKISKSTNAVIVYHISNILLKLLFQEKTEKEKGEGEREGEEREREGHKMSKAQGCSG